MAADIRASPLLAANAPLDGGLLSDSGILESLLDGFLHKLYHSIVPSLHLAFSSYAVQTMKGLGCGDDSMLRELLLLSLLLLKRRTVAEALRNQF